ncbi:hypothetical protein DFH09DRAFT_1074574 [Mycena vulgaris]|nr:hypothetical protein DFH09DRAFT_1074574 [Mycena vulgaris]
MNNVLYDLADRLPHSSNNNSTGELAFSIHYQHFIQGLRNATLSVSKDQAAKLSDLQKNQTAACVDRLAAATDDAYTGYQKLHGTAKMTDTIFIQFATENYGEYEQAVSDCNNAKNAYNKAVLRCRFRDSLLVFSIVLGGELDKYCVCYPRCTVQLLVARLGIICCGRKPVYACSGLIFLQHSGVPG